MESAAGQVSTGAKRLASLARSFLHRLMCRDSWSVLGQIVTLLETKVVFVCMCVVGCGQCGDEVAYFGMWISFPCPNVLLCRIVAFLLLYLIFLLVSRSFCKLFSNVLISVFFALHV